VRRDRTTLEAPGPIGFLASLCAALLALGVLSIPAQAQPEGREFVEVDWSKLEDDIEQRRVERAELTPRLSQMDMSRCRVPILLPKAPEMMTAVEVYPQSNFYSAFVRRGPRSVEIMGTRVVRTGEAMRRMSRPMMTLRRDDGYIIYRNDYGIELTFTRYGVAYALSVQCEEPGQDPHCTDESYIRGIAETLSYVGGRPEEDAP